MLTRQRAEKGIPSRGNSMCKGTEERSRQG